jgi:hypothetical protein
VGVGDDAEGEPQCNGDGAGRDWREEAWMDGWMGCYWGGYWVVVLEDVRLAVYMYVRMLLLEMDCWKWIAVDIVVDALF